MLELPGKKKIRVPRSMKKRYFQEKKADFLRKNPILRNISYSLFFVVKLEQRVPN